MKTELLKPAVKFLEKLTKADQIRIISAIKKLPQGDVALLKGKKITAYRLRVGSYRILFKYESELCVITEIGNRGDVYK